MKICDKLLDSIKEIRQQAYQEGYEARKREEKTLFQREAEEEDKVRAKI